MISVNDIVVKTPNRTNAPWSTIESVEKDLPGDDSATPVMLLKIPYRFISLRMRQVLAYIHLYYARAIGLSDAASVIGVHPDYLSRRFKKELGIQFHDYLLWIRIHRARVPLVSSTKSVKEIGYEVGFSRPEIFSKVFKRLVGCSPKAYRASGLSTSMGPCGAAPAPMSSHHLLALAERDAFPNRSLQTILEVIK